LPKLDDANTVAYGLRSSFDRKLRNLRGIANSGLTDLDNLFRDGRPLASPLHRRAKKSRG